MKKTFHLLILALLLGLSSCVYSLFPIYTKDTIVYLKELEGTWKDKEGGIFVFSKKPSSLFLPDEPITIVPGITEYILIGVDTIRDEETLSAYWKSEEERVLDQKYVLTTIKNDDTLNFTGVLAKIDENYFLDMSPGEGLDDEYISQNLFPVHTFLKLEVLDDQLIMTQFELDKLKDLFESNRIRLRHEKVKGSIVITAQPKDIQKFLISYSRDESVFANPDLYQRVIP